jgi:glycosyltransferase involved in cell wall biosynthesis
LAIFALLAYGLSMRKNLAISAIQGWMYHGNLAASLLSAVSGIRAYWSVHHSIDDIRNEKLKLRAVIWLSGVVSGQPFRIQFCSQKSLEQHARWYGIDKSHIIPNGFMISESDDSLKYDDAMRLRLGLEPNVPVIGHVGRFHPMKDHRNFISAAGLLKEAGIKAHFVAIGRNVSDTNEYLVRLRREQNLDRKMHFLDERDDIAQCMKSFDLLTTSSAYGEALPLVLGEAMSLGVPVVATDVGDCRELVGDAGIVVPPKNSLALAKAWEKILNETKEQRAYRRSRGVERIRRTYSISAVRGQFLDMYGIK